MDLYDKVQISNSGDRDRCGNFPPGWRNLHEKLMSGRETRVPDAGLFVFKGKVARLRFNEDRLF
jgi:hypothetical protein